MLIQESHVDVPTTADGQGKMRKYTLHPYTIPLAYVNSILPDDICANPLLGIYVFHPSIPGYPNARFPGVVVFSEIYQGAWSEPTLNARFLLQTIT